MPIYEYKCQECGRTAEILQMSQKQSKLISCPYCGSTKMQKLLSMPAAITIKGSNAKGTTCCGREERCDTPPCSTDGTCKRDSD